MSSKSQGILSFTLVPKPTTCTVCAMNYCPYIDKDVSVHTRYHESFVNGPRCDMSHESACKKTRMGSGKKAVQCSVYSVNRKDIRLVRKVEALLEMVNRELAAPTENSFWKRTDTTSLGHAFIAIIERRLVGVCITEPVVEKQTRWIIDRTQAVVPNQTIKHCKVGISRIWVASKWRRRGIAQLLLETVLSGLVYGLELAKRDLAFSQPSHAGGKLARKFVGVPHKSGETLIPIYLE